MKLLDVLAIVTSSADEHVIAFAEQLRERNAAHLSTFVVNWLPSVPIAAEGWVVDPYWGEAVEHANQQLTEEVEKLRTRQRRDYDAPKPEALLLEVGAARSVLGMRALHSDITIVGRPTKSNAVSAHAILEGPLFQSGRPVMVVPPEWKPADVSRSILVCWKPTREAARALSDAEGFLADAGKITIVTADAEPAEGGYGDLPGADIATHLAHRQLNVELVNLATAGRTETKTILDQALAVDASLIVMGGYGRSRMSEFIFGGVTRDMLRTSPAPILLSH